MNDKALQDIKEEMGQISTRLDNVEGYFGNFNTTLENHMTDYKENLKETNNKIREISGRLSWGFWVIFGLLIMALGGLIGGAVVLLINAMKETT